MKDKKTKGGSYCRIPKVGDKDLKQSSAVEVMFKNVYEMKNHHFFDEQSLWD